MNWQVATDPEFRTVVRAGSENTTPELAHSARAHPHSTGGRLGSGPDHLRIGLMPIVGGRPLRRRPHHGPGGPRPCRARGAYTYEGKNHETLADFRNNHAKYKSSLDLQGAR